MPDSFDTLQRQRPERRGRGGPGGRAGGERAGRGDVSRERAECSGHPRFYSPSDLLVPFPPAAPEPRKLPRVSGRAGTGQSSEEQRWTLPQPTEMKKQRLREVKGLPRDHTADDRQPPVPSSSQLLPHHVSGDSMGKTQF
ncbi:hypothetical protein CapIbe_012403 [Capra ibex]